MAKQRMGMWSIDFKLRENREADPKFGRAELLDLRIGAGLLCAELIAWKGEHAQSRVEPIYETAEGWNEATAKARSWAQLPGAAVKYVRRIEELIGCPVALLSTSPEREDTILMQNPFEA